MKLKGEKMFEYGILFCFVVTFLLVGIYILENRNKTDAKDLSLLVKEDVGRMKTDVGTLTGAVNRVAIESASNEQRVNDILKRTEALEKEADATEEMCLKLREGQSQLNDRISRKRPVIKMPTGAIQVEILPGTNPKKDYASGSGSAKNNAVLGKGMKAILKDAAR